MTWCSETRDVTKAKPAELVRAGLVQVLEGRHCFRNLTVEENLIAGTTSSKCQISFRAGFFLRNCFA
ncbi:ABC-type branched-subunit amino acid transport system ATPase component [Rhizobium leguminosarum]|nr:ABC-type branched-subunit amino acid transport system ATPase component [Rhizobium leguminosarum]